MLGLGGAALYNGAGLFLLEENAFFYLLAFFGATPVWRDLMAKLPQNPGIRLLKTGGYLLILLLAASYLAMGAHNPFIYFNF